MGDKSPKKVDESENTGEHSGDEGFPTPRDEHGNRILKKPVAQQTRNDISTGTGTSDGEGATGQSPNAANAETGGDDGKTSLSIVDDRSKKTPPRDDAMDEDFEAEYLTSNRLDMNLEKDVLAAENILDTLRDMPQVCRGDLDDILEFEGVIEHSIQSLRNPSRTIEPELYGRIVDANQALLRWKARMNKWKRQFVDQPLSSGSSQNNLWEDQVATQKLAEKRAEEEEKRCRDWEKSMASALLFEQKLSEQLLYLRTQRDKFQSELGDVRTTLDKLRADGKTFGMANDEIEGREEVLLAQAKAAEIARDAAGKSAAAHKSQQQITDPETRKRRAEAAGAKRKSDLDYMVSFADAKKSRTQSLNDEHVLPSANIRSSASNVGTRAYATTGKSDANANTSRPVSSTMTTTPRSSRSTGLPPIFTLSSRENSPLLNTGRKETPPDLQAPFNTKKSSSHTKSLDRSKLVFGPESGGFPKTSTPFTARRSELTDPRRITFERENSPPSDREQSPPSNDRDDERSEASFETGATSIIPRLWETQPTIESGALKPPKYHVSKWDGNVTTYPDHISAFKEFVHSRADILIPQKIQILEGSLPKNIASNFTHYDQNTVGYENRLQFLHNRYGDISVLHTALWTQISEQPKARDNIPSIRDTLDLLEAKISKFRKYATQVDEELLFNIVISKFPTDSYQTHIAPPARRVVETVFQAVRDYIAIAQLSMSQEAIISTLNPPAKEKASGDRPRDNAYGDRRHRPFDRKSGDKGEYKQKQPKGGLAYTTKESRYRQNKSRQLNNSPTSSQSVSDPLDPRRFPSSFARQDPEPKRTLCPLCAKKHHAHLCMTYPLLKERQQVRKDKGLCEQCLVAHIKPAKGVCDRGPKACRWWECAQEGHHAAFCPAQTYPITPGKVRAWKEALAEVKEKARTLYGDEHESKCNTNTTHNKPFENVIINPTVSVLQDSKQSRSQSPDQILHTTFSDHTLIKDLTTEQRDALPKMSKSLNFALI